jgi:hypothetical protein
MNHTHPNDPDAPAYDALDNAPLGVAEAAAAMQAIAMHFGWDNLTDALIETIRDEIREAAPNWEDMDEAESRVACSLADALDVLKYEIARQAERNERRARSLAAYRERRLSPWQELGHIFGGRTAPGGGK